MQRYVHNAYRSHAQSGEGFDTPSAPCVPVNEGQDIHLRTIEDIGHARESGRPILNRVPRKTEAGALSTSFSCPIAREQSTIKQLPMGETS
jgi:hypothetical protein